MRYPQGILVSCEIPWDDKERLLEGLFRKEVQMAISKGFTKVYIFGTAGEGYAVDTANFQRIVEIFRDETKDKNVLAQVGVIGLSTATIVERLEFAHRCGFRDFQISLPCWSALRDDELLTFFKDVCGHFPDSRFLHYNLGRSRRVLTPTDYRRVADVIPNLAATKITTQDISVACQLMRLVPEIQHFFGESLFPIGSLHGECSLLSSFGMVFPRRTQEFFEYGRTKQFDKLFPMFRDYMRFMDDFAAPLVGKDLIDGAYDKMLVRLGGMEFPPRLLSPYEWFSEEEFQACQKMVQQKWSHWD